MKTALLLVDIQNDYFPGGKMELEGPVEAAQKANELLQCFRDHDMPTVHIQPYMESTTNLCGSSAMISVLINVRR